MPSAVFRRVECPGVGLVMLTLSGHEPIECVCGLEIGDDLGTSSRLSESPIFAAYLVFVALLLTILLLGVGLMWLLNWRHMADRAAAVFRRVIEPWPVWFYGHPLYYRVFGGLMVASWLAVTGILLAQALGHRSR